MIIIIAGIKRSGSTWMYNVVRVIAMIHGTVAVSGQNNVDLSKDFNIIKIHPFKKKLAEAGMVLTSIRDEKDIMVSLKRKLDGELRGKNVHINWMMSNLNKWRKHSVYEMDFNNIGTVEEIRNISKAIGLKCDPFDIKKKVDKIKPGKEYDKTTFLFPNHITT